MGCACQVTLLQTDMSTYRWMKVCTLCTSAESSQSVDKAHPGILKSTRPKPHQYAARSSEEGCSGLFQPTYPYINTFLHNLCVVSITVSPSASRVPDPIDPPFFFPSSPFSPAFSLISALLDGLTI
jgi:hypothetical protein